MAEPRDYRQADLFRPALEAIIDMGHPLVRLAAKIDWGFLDRRFGEVYAAGAGQPPLPTRLVAGLFILKHMHYLSDEALCARWVENPYYQYFCGERVFRHELAFDRSSLTRWRQRLGEEQLVGAVPGEPVGRAQNGSAGDEGPGAGRGRHDGAAEGDRASDRRAAHPPGDREARRLRQAPRRRAAAELSAGRQARGDHGRALYPRPPVQARRRALKFLRTRLGRLIRDISRKIAGDPALAERFAPLLALAVKVRFQDQRQRGPKVYSLHAPEVECIGKGKARAPYEFGCKVSIATPSPSPRAASSCCTPRRCTAIPSTATRWAPFADMERNTGVEARRIHVDKGYRGHNHPNRFRVWISGQVRRTTAAIRREMKRRAAVEPVIGHVKAEHRMDRNYLKGRDGDRINAVLAAAGYNFPLLLRWLAALLRAIFLAAFQSLVSPQPACHFVSGGTSRTTKEAPRRE